MTEQNDTQAGGGETLTLTQAELDARIKEASEAAVEALKAKNAELLGETKQERQKRQALEAAQAEAERKRAEEKGEYQRLYQAEQEARAKIEAELSEYREKVTRSTLDGEAKTIAAELSRDTARAALLAEQAQKFIKPTDDGLKFEIGGVEVDRAKALDHLRASFPFLVDGSQASGGGATGGNGGAVSQKKPDEMTAQERRQLLNDDPDAFYKAFPKAKLR